MPINEMDDNPVGIPEEALLAEDDEIQEVETPEEPPLEKLLRYADMQNIAEELDEQTLMDIGKRTYKEYTIDDDSRSDWLERNEEAIKLASQIIEEKSYPWPGSANVKYPLIADAAIQFNARAYPSIVKGNDVVKATTIGEDPSGEKSKRADRISKHMSYQLLYQMEEWEEDTDKLLVILPIVGNVFRKSYYSPLMQRNMTKLVRAEDLIYNHESNFHTTPRITEKITLYQQSITERTRLGLFRDVDLNIRDEEDEPEEDQEFIEQHRREDLDEDGYKEPYIVTVHKDTKQVVRIVANFDPADITVRHQGRVDTVRNIILAIEQMKQQLPEDARKPEFDTNATILKIDPTKYYTKYTFIPSLDGKGYDLGLGQLLGPLSETVNTSLNQMLDAGTLSNLQGGFISDDVSGNNRRGEFNVGPNEWIPLSGAFGSIRDKVYPFDFQGPNQVMFSLLQFLISTGKELAAINTDTDSAGANESPTTYMARLSEGLRVFNGTYKRIHRALKQEYAILYRLNKDYMPPREYFNIMDTQEAVTQTDYKMRDVDVMPVSDPSASTTEQRMAKAQVIYQVGKDNPRYDQYSVEKEYLDAMGIPGLDKLIRKDEEMPEPPPDPETVEIQAKIEKMAAETEKVKAETAQTYESIKNSIVELNQKFEELDLTRIKTQLDYLSSVVTQEENYDLHKKVMGGENGESNSTGVPGVEGQSGNAEGNANPGGES